ncbi:hypothetical protein D3C72_2362470 [compost metagenome]
MAERDDAGIAEDQVERDGEQRQDGDLGEDQHLRRQDEDQRYREQPQADLPEAPAARLPEQRLRGVGGG